MKFKTPLIEARFLKRYKRFFADINLKTDQGEQTVVAHVANTGSLKSVLNPGCRCLLSPAENPERKLRFTLEALEVNNSWVGINTSWPNALAKEAFEQKIFSHWQAYDVCQPEVKISPETRLDLLLKNSQTGDCHYVEIKNVTLAEGETAMFPDAVTERGQKHLRELMALQEKGHTCEILFTVQRTDCKQFAPAEMIDPDYAKLLRQAHAQGVRVTVAVIVVNPDSIVLTSQYLPLKL